MPNPVGLIKNFMLVRSVKELINHKELRDQKTALIRELLIPVADPPEPENRPLLEVTKIQDAGFAMAELLPFEQAYALRKTWEPMCDRMRLVRAGRPVSQPLLPNEFAGTLAYVLRGNSFNNLSDEIISTGLLIDPDNMQNLRAEIQRGIREELEKTRCADEAAY